ncbi:MAG: DUF4905 domain-containing protein [Bacteroidota bacterium]
MSQLVKKSYQFEDHYRVWKIVKPNEGMLLVAELRNPVELTTVFVCIDVERQEVLWDDLAFEDSWSISISGMNATHIFFTEFTDEQMPKAKAVFSVALYQKEIAWYIENVTFEGLQNNFVVLKEEKSEVYRQLLVDSNIGETIDTQTQIQLEASTDKSLLHPMKYAEDNAYFDTVKRFIKKTLSLSIVISCDYIEWGNFIIISFYQANTKNTFNNYIAIFNHSGEVILQDVLGEDLKGIASESFFIVRNYLIYIIENKDIITINLTSTL